MANNSSGILPDVVLVIDDDDDEDDDGIKKPQSVGGNCRKHVTMNAACRTRLGLLLEVIVFDGIVIVRLAIYYC